MIKFYKKIAILLSALVLLSFNIVTSSNYTNSKTNNNSTATPTNTANFYPYTIYNYDISIVVNENNTLQITENLGVYFNTPRHGIIRKIPIKNKVTRLDGSTSYNYSRISNINVAEKHTISTENGNKIIKIGDEDQTLRGPKNYSISYLYDLGKDKIKNYDELYFNLIGNEWDTTISNIDFTITMPKDFDKSKLGFSSRFIWIYR